MSLPRLITLGIMLFTGGFVVGAGGLALWWLWVTSNKNHAWDLIAGAFQTSPTLRKWLRSDDRGLSCPSCKHTEILAPDDDDGDAAPASPGARGGVA